MYGVEGVTEDMSAFVTFTLIDKLLYERSSSVKFLSS